MVTLYDPLVVALTTASRVDFVANPYNSVIQNPTTATSAPVGVAMLATTSGYYGWIQTGGVGVVKADAGAAVTVGTSVVASNGTAGCVEGEAGAQAPVGIALTGIATGEFGTAHLTLD